MPAIADTTSGGDGSDFRAEVGTWPGLLAEVEDKGYWVRIGGKDGKWVAANKGDKKAKHKTTAIFLLPTQLCGDDAPDDRKGTPKLVVLNVPNLSFNETDDPEWRSLFQHYLTGWFGRAVPPDKWEQFCFGREYGDGPGQLKRGLKGAALKAQIAALPGVPVGCPALITVEHNPDKDGKIWANIGPPRPKAPPQDRDELERYLEVMKTWKPGLSPADTEARSYTFDNDMNLLKGGEATGYVYPGWEVIKGGSGESGSGGGSTDPEKQQFDPEPEDDSDIPF